MKGRSFSQQSLIEYCTLEGSDIEIINECRGDYNRLGFGYQLVFVKLFNVFPKTSPFEIIEAIVIFTAIQLLIAAEAIRRYTNNRGKL